MAISKEKKLENGAVGSYWKIDQIDINKIDMHAHYNLSLYADQEHADKGVRLGLNKDFSFPVTKKDLSGDVIAFGYTSIKEQKDQDLIDGEDV